MKKSLKNKIKNEYLGRAYATFCGMLIIILTISIIYFITSKGIKLFTQNKQSILEFLFSKVWDPEEKKYGALIYILGSSAVSLGAVIISTPLAIALAIFMNMISPKLGEKVMQPAMELFVGIPSVVYGWIGISVLVPIIKNYLGGLGFSLLAGILVLSVMILPTITSIASDAIKTVPKEYMESSYGLGATRWQTIKGIVVPSAKTGISTGIVLGLARAFGEALAVQMVIGNALRIPSKLLKPSSTLTGAITMDMGNTVMGTEWNNALWSMALLLLIISFIFILIIRAISKRGEI
ncbi:phosphate ABC transporter permease subunit PstC [Clostridium algidicarnis]|uniref:Phosphate transport system permease protein n=2 Tax=Clostridium algidicarnis TaxID=37659 RepID=A0A2S6G185_9CLOT|nr:phosphate ABC transporter permease subunit PstC [Clostridium algidicarnis]MBB6631130.1 phosphate ABC transporter permease subunit PstC [Clostridium algidicarnis]MBB6696218.1 phosphate ABC transporter permease subunit PstC [Clostridium algidicarnis]MBU3193433.1 phosphate ABC transporter permease subunit PstC [Clostridium algidicarnis]MBU3203162.1 phosphate ABC transporter permease subunit PstC [Clostridium algidicarnis]MBU3205544.1 phosphate ABC transporter permease subunit PstC [Clostridium